MIDWNDVPIEDPEFEELVEYDLDGKIEEWKKLGYPNDNLKGFANYIITDVFNWVYKEDK